MTKQILEHIEAGIDALDEYIYQSYHKKLISLGFELSYEDSKQIYDATNSFRNSLVSRRGKIFETHISEFLRNNHVSFEEQVSIDLNNNCFRAGKKEPVVDFVIKHSDDETLVNQNISEFIIISRKYTCRERYKQDDWTYVHTPLKYILLVGSNDYPKTFVDTDTRVLITLVNKQGDKRKGIDALLSEISYIEMSQTTPESCFSTSTDESDVSVESTESQDSSTLRYIDLCCGIGSFHHSMQTVQPNSRCVMACDILKCARNTYKSNYDIEPLTDLCKLDYNDFDADIVFSGNPCQSFSQIGNQRGFDDPRGNIFIYILDNIMSMKKYKVFVFENVVGLTTNAGGRTFETILTKIQSHGYTPIHRILKCSDYGIPQNRKRVFIVCIRNDLLKQCVDYNKRFDDIINKYCEHVTLTEYLDNGLTFKRDTALTIRCGGVGSPIDSKQNWDGYYVTDADNDEEQEYRLTINDMKKLQGFEDDFKLVGTVSEQRKMLGNTIPTNLTEIVCEFACSIL